MAGSLNHIIDDDGAFTMETIENMGDAHEALEECFDIIALLLEFVNLPREILQEVCDRAKAPMPKALPRFGVRAEPTRRRTYRRSEPWREKPENL